MNAVSNLRDHFPPDSPPGSVVSVANLIQMAAAYLPEQDLRHIKDAYRFSDAAHLGQFRATGEPYISHPIAVAEYCAYMKLDGQALQAALLHDVMEDSGATKEELIERFGVQVADLVDGLSKLDKIEFSSREEAQAENFRKMLLAMARDVRVILIKLADRLHNMKTLTVMAPAKKRRISRETLEIYAPIANRLGLNEIFRSLQELSFQHLNPMRYAVLQKAVVAARGNRREVVSKILEAAHLRLEERRIDAKVFGREKGLFGIYRKMLEKRLSFGQVLDIYGFRIVVKDVPTCYVTLGLLHELFRPVPGKFKDYIAIPKINGYQSLHTTLVGPFGTPVEFQIRTEEMHQIAENGVAAHWLYKEDGSRNMNDVQKVTHRWLQSLLDIQNQTGDSAEFLEHIKVDLFPDAVYVFTPKGKIMCMPRGATIIDFAYAVHTAVGNQCVAAKVNNITQPLRSELKNGDLVEVITAPHSCPNPSWLSFVRTGKARSEIRHFLKTMDVEETVELGRRLLNQALEPDGVSLGDLSTATWEKLVKDSRIKSAEELLAEIGSGRRVAPVVARRVLMALGVTDNTTLQGKARTPILIHGGEGLAVQRAQCCMPIPGDSIHAYLKKGAGLALHTTDCEIAKSAMAKEPERWTEVEWAEDITRVFDVNIDIDIKNERGSLTRVSAAISDEGANISNLSMNDDLGPQKLMHFTVQVSDRNQLAKVIKAVRRINLVNRVARVRNKIGKHYLR
ncbi:MAG: bifunctional (p)ppGpp synthetase/guanosine-3',5'-bis(diphosphate) 3'-pyrophosphohydrolase [Burkholderiales bacterium]|nr:bifunctional (p)ppGpp synthetase/guanosine-3',5'-bis(diphosphate) 3'-pyrophosphohydrolase [Burkholderiales bacterium]